MGATIPTAEQAMQEQRSDALTNQDPMYRWSGPNIRNVDEKIAAAQARIRRNNAHAQDDHQFCKPSECPGAAAEEMRQQRLKQERS